MCMYMHVPYVCMQLFDKALMGGCRQDYVATRWYRAPELCGSFFSKVHLTSNFSSPVLVHLVADIEKGFGTVKVGGGSFRVH